MILHPKKRRVHKLIEEYFWDGFWRRLDSDKSVRGRLSSYRDYPAWWDEIADIASKAGYDAAEAKLAGGRILSGRPEIPARVYADAYGAAKLIDWRI